MGGTDGLGTGVGVNTMGALSGCPESSPPQLVPKTDTEAQSSMSIICLNRLVFLVTFLPFSQLRRLQELELRSGGATALRWGNAIKAITAIKLR